MKKKIKTKRNRILLGALVATTNKTKAQMLLTGATILYAYEALSYKTIASFTLLPNI